MSTGIEPTITLTKENGTWVAEDTATGVASQGSTRDEALANLDEAVAAYQGEGHEPSAEELRETGIDPDQNESENSTPEWLE